MPEPHLMFVELLAVFVCLFVFFGGEGELTLFCFECFMTISVPNYGICLQLFLEKKCFHSFYFPVLCDDTICFDLLTKLQLLTLFSFWFLSHRYVWKRVCMQSFWQTGSGCSPGNRFMSSGLKTTLPTLQAIFRGCLIFLILVRLASLTFLPIPEFIVPRLKSHPSARYTCCLSCCFMCHGV